MKNFSMFTRCLLLVGILFSIVLFLSACDPYFRIDGMTYEWINAPSGSTSIIYITKVKAVEDVEPTLRNMETSISNEISIIPLANVELSTSDQNGNNPIFRVNSDVTGDFHWAFIGSPGPSYRIIANKPGYNEATKDVSFKPGEGYPVLVVILVKK